jgi:hypothetical protein
MSTKTLRKRISLVAVTALGAGLLSVVAVPAANASAVAPADSKLYLATVTAGTAALPAAPETDVVPARSAGLITSITTNLATTQTATMLSTGALSVTAGASGSGTASKTAIVVTGGRITAFDSESGTATGSSLSDAGTFVLAETALNMHCWGENPVVVAKLQLNGQDRFSEREGSYFDVVQPFQHHTRNPDTGINVNSFAMRPE